MMLEFYGKFKSDLIYTGFYAYKNNTSQKEKIFSSFDEQTQEIYFVQDTAHDLVLNSKEIIEKNTDRTYSEFSNFFY